MGRGRNTERGRARLPFLPGGGGHFVVITVIRGFSIRCCFSAVFSRGTSVFALIGWSVMRDACF